MAERGIRAGRAFVELSADNTRLTRGLRRAQAKLRAFAAQADRLGRSTRDIGGRLARIGGFAAAGFGIAAAIFGRFDDRMRQVQAVTQANEEQFKLLREEAKRLGRTTSFSASQVAELMVELGRAGFAPQEIERSTEAILNLARSTSTDLARSAEIAANTLRAFNIEATETGRVADVLAAAANKSSQDLSTLFESLKFVAPIAKEAGLSLEEVAADIGVMANNAVKGSQAGTSFRRILINLSKEANRSKLNELGVNVKDAEGNFRSLTDILSDTQKALKDMGEVERSAFLSDVFGARALQVVQKLLPAAAGGGLRDFREELENMAGFSERVAKQMDAGIGGAFRRLISAAEAAAIEIGKSVGDSITGLLKILTQTFRAIADFANDNRELLDTIFKVTLAVTAAGAALFTLGIAIQVVSFAAAGLATGIGALIGVFTTAAAVIGALTTPIGLVVSGFASLTAGVAGATGAIDKAVNFMNRKFGQLAEVATKTFAGIRDALLAGDIEAAANVLWAGLRLAWQQGTAELENLWIDFKGSFLQTFNDIWFGAQAILNDAVAGMKKIWNDWTSFIAKQAIEAKNSFVTAWDVLTTKAKQAANDIKAAFDEGFDAEDANANLRDKFAERQRERRKNEQAVTAEIEKQRKAREKAIESERQQQRRDLRDELEAAQNEAQQQQQQQEQAAKQELEAAKKNLDQARQRAAEAAEEARNAADDQQKEAQEGADEAGKKADEVSTGVAGGAAQSFAKGGAAGTFNALALQGLSTGQGDDRVVQANEQTAQRIAQLDKNLRRFLAVD